MQGTCAERTWDVVVVGGGNAGVVAAMEARERGCVVALLERAPLVFRAGNSRHTRNIRCVHTTSDSYSPGTYTAEELWKDLCGVGTGPNDELLARMTVEHSESVPRWMEDHGARWQKPLRGTLHLGRTNRFFLGGGKALLNSYYRTLGALGIPVHYESTVESLGVCGRRIDHVNVEAGGRRYKMRGRAFVFASGGYEANQAWLAECWGDAASNFRVRGTAYNDGSVLRELFAAGARSAGNERGFHAVAVDARSPAFDGGIATRIDAIPFGVVVNRNGRRFYDEGEDLWPKRYAIWGGRIAEQPGQIAYAIWDSKVDDRFLPPMYGAYRSETIEGLATVLGIDGVSVATEIARYNAAVPATGAPFDPSALDGRSTSGISPPKSNWAQRIDTPPIYGIPIRPGITFTYRGVAVNSAARIQLVEGGEFHNSFAAGEIMSGNVLSNGYLAGFGMTIGTVWGRIAGKEAAAHALA